MGDTASAEAGRGHRLLSEMWQVCEDGRQWRAMRWLRCRCLDAAGSACVRQKVALHEGRRTANGSL